MSYKKKCKTSKNRPKIVSSKILINNTKFLSKFTQSFTKLLLNFMFVEFNKNYIKLL